MPAPLLRHKAYDEPSVFAPENLLPEGGTAAEIGMGSGRFPAPLGIEAGIREEGFEPFYQAETLLWTVELYEREDAFA